MFIGSYILYLIIPAAFIIGSVPFGVLLTRGKGIDLRNTGSGNIGATNVLRSSGKIPALLTLAGDAAKGAFSVLVCRYVFNRIDPSSSAAAYGGELWEGLVGITVVLGHMYSVFLSFRGGKGVATGFGVIAVFSPSVALISLLTWIAVSIITGYSSVAAITSVGILPLIYILSQASAVKIVFGIFLAVLIVYKHKLNIENLISGNESKIGDSRN